MSNAARPASRLTPEACAFVHQHAWDLNRLPDGQFIAGEVPEDNDFDGRWKLLHDHGLIESVGERTVGPGTDVTVWRLTDEGRSAIERELAETDTSVCPRCHHSGWSNPVGEEGYRCVRCGRSLTREEVRG